MTPKQISLFNQAMAEEMNKPKTEWSALITHEDRTEMSLECRMAWEKNEPELWERHLKYSYQHRNYTAKEYTDGFIKCSDPLNFACFLLADKEWGWNHPKISYWCSFCNHGIDANDVEEHDKHCSFRAVVIKNQGCPACHGQATFHKCTVCGGTGKLPTKARKLLEEMVR